VILALAGGVGGAKRATGLARVLPPSELTVVVNTADDFEHLGLLISPDLDTVMYNLAGIHNPELGWGIAGETWNFMQALKALGGETWFQLGDRDLATHTERTRRLKAGESLSAVTQSLCERLGVQHRVVPMSDDPVRTIVHTDRGVLAFQDYFVRLRCEPVVNRIEYEGADRAQMSAGFEAALNDDQLKCVVICPSNPFLSIGPMLALAGAQEKLRSRGVPIVAVSPIVGGQAVKGPAAKIFKELGREASATEVARFYLGLVDSLILDETDRNASSAIAELGIDPVITNSVMRSLADKERLAREVTEKSFTRAAGSIKSS
jgi:LPPG:FO 2-phospho-L-lactate transferase